MVTTPVRRQHAKLICTCAGELTTTASQLPASPVPNSLIEDAIRSSNAPLFSGESNAKTVLFLIIPIIVSTVVVIFSVCIWIAGWTFAATRSEVKETLRVNPDVEIDTFRRLLKHGNRFGQISAVGGIVLFCAYLIIRAQNQSPCAEGLSVGVSSLARSLFPWSQSFEQKAFDAPQACFIIVACAVYLVSNLVPLFCKYGNAYLLTSCVWWYRARCGT